MSTNLLYHTFSIRGYEYVRTPYKDDQVNFTIRQETRKFETSRRSRQHPKA